MLENRSVLLRGGGLTGITTGFNGNKGIFHMPQISSVRVQIISWCLRCPYERECIFLYLPELEACFLGGVGAALNWHCVKSHLHWQDNKYTPIGWDKRNRFMPFPELDQPWSKFKHRLLISSFCLVSGAQDLIPVSLTLPPKKKKKKVNPGYDFQWWWGSNFGNLGVLLHWHYSQVHSNSEW